MTNAEVLARFSVVWNGCSYLLPAYESKTTLTEAIQTLASPRQPHERPRSIHPRKGQSKYPLAVKQAVQAARRDGMKLTAIAEQFELPLVHVFTWVQEA